MARGGQGQGLLLHGLTAGDGMPLAQCLTPANGDERAPVLPLLDLIQRRPGHPGRPRTRPKVLAMAQGDEAQALRQQLRQRGIRAQIPKRVWKTKQKRGRPITVSVPRFQAERTFAWFPKTYRRLVVRWDRLAACFAAFWALAMIHMWVHRLLVG